MGNSTSQKNAPSNELQTKQEEGGKPFISLDSVNRSVCQIVYHNEAGRLRTLLGVAINYIDDDGTVYYGIVTPNLSFDFPLSLQYCGESIGYTIDLSHTYTCPVLNITLIKLPDDYLERLLQLGCFFNNVQYEERSFNTFTKLCVLKGRKDTDPYFDYYSCKFKEYYGNDIVYSFERNPSDRHPIPPAHTGLPVATITAELVGIHKGSRQNEWELIAISAKAISNAIQQLIRQTTPITHFISNPLDTSGYEGKLEENGLEVMSCTDSERYKNCTMYISPASPLITPIWFMPTYLGWYWTPTDPNGPVYPNWMSVDRLEVIGGDLNGDIPAPKNIAIIRWLDQHNIDSYISSSNN